MLKKFEGIVSTLYDETAKLANASGDENISDEELRGHYIPSAARALKMNMELSNEATPFIIARMARDEDLNFTVFNFVG